MNSIIESVSKSGKYIFCIPLIMFGISHLTKADTMAGMVPVPGGVFWVYFTGVAMLAAAVAIITNAKGLGLQEPMQVAPMNTPASSRS